MIAHIVAHTLPAAFALLPGKMDTPAARAMVIAIGLQESKFRARRQITGRADYSPARGFWQFEMGGGIVGVLTHRSTKPIITDILEELRYSPAASSCYEAVEHNDVLAAVFARLNLWWLPGPVAQRGEVDRGWRQYLNAWRPGRPHPETWPEHFARAWELVR